MELSAIAKIRARLAAMKSALEDRFETDDSSMRRGTLGAMQHQPKRKLGDAAQHAVRLQQIETAIARLEIGKYGYCAICNVEIEDRRLEADPSTTICAKCGGDQQ